MDYPLISIITPSFNQGQYLEQTIQSVLNQNYPNLEYIIIDGASQDNSVEIIKKYENQLAYWISEPDKGQSEAINKGLKKANGLIINWLNSDDYYEPNTLWKIAETFQKNPEALMIGGRSRIFYNSGETSHYSQGTDIYPNNLAKTIGWARIDQPETFFHRKAIEKMGLLDSNLHYLMDRDWWIKFLLHFGLNQVVKIEDILVNFRLHDNSKTVSQANYFQKEHDSYFFALAREYQLTDYQQFIEKNIEIISNFKFENLPKVELDLMKTILNYYFLQKADESYAQNNFKLLDKYLKIIDLHKLELVDKKLWQKLNFRSKFLPFRWLKIWRDKQSK